jgi:galactoside O-acetyltransferase
MTDRERMDAGLLYDPGEESIMAEQMPCQELLWKYNHMGPSEYDERHTGRLGSLRKPVQGGP